MLKDLPPILRFLRDELKYRVRVTTPTLGYERFYVDLSSWRMRLSNTPVIWLKANQIESLSPKHVVESLHDADRELRQRRDPLIVLFDGDSRSIREHMSNTAERRGMVIIGAEEQEEVLRSPRPS